MNDNIVFARVVGLSWTLALLLLSAPLLTSSVVGQKAGLPPENLSLRNEVEHAIDRGVRWLIRNQDAKGYWSTADHPAVSALVLVALQGQPNDSVENKREALKKGYSYIVGLAKPDGGIYQKELANYNTALSLMALLAARDPEFKPLITKARGFLIGLQSDFGDPGKLDTPLDGGVGYGSKYQHSDMSNTLAALEALYYSNRLLTDSDLKSTRDLNWSAAIHFIQNCQNLPSHNRQDWVSGDPSNLGGFVYYPGKSMAGETNLASGKIALRSYGSISYAGLLSYIYADMKKDDPRVMAVINWLKDNFSLEENPGMGPQGLYFYFHTMAKALTLYGADELKVKEGRAVDWRKELSLKLLNLQQRDGSWVNENARWWEKDAALVTAYSLIALEMIHRGL